MSEPRSLRDILRSHGLFVRKRTPSQVELFGFKRGAPAVKSGPIIWGDRGAERLIKPGAESKP